MKKKICIIILAVTVPLLCFSYWVFASFHGSLIRKIVMTAQAKEYIAGNYPDKDLFVDFADYDFKMSGYYCDIHTDPESDLHFMVYEGGDGNLTDDYELRVLNKENTILRLSLALDDYTDDFLSANFPHRTSLTLCDADWDALEKQRAAIPLDMPFDLETFPFSCTMTVWAETAKGTPDWEELAERLKELYEVTKDAYPFVTHYSMSIQAPFIEIEGEWGPEDYSADVSVFDVPREVIAGNELETWLEAERLRQEKELEELQNGELPADKTE